MAARGRTADGAQALRAPLASLPASLPIPTLVSVRGQYRHVALALRPPGSKSLANRALLLAGLATGRSVITGLPVAAEDVHVMLDAIGALGAGVTVRDDRAEVDGVGGRWPASGVTLDLRNAGTATRFLAAASILARGSVTLDGNARMRQRPIGQLATIIRKLGGSVEFLGAEGCPPLRVSPPASPAAPLAPITIPTTLSGQFISAALLIAPWLSGPGGLTLKLTGEVTSASYITMTLGLLGRLGADVRSSHDLRVVRVAGPPPAAFDLALEADASAATYWWGLSAILPGASIRVAGIEPDSLQGDSRFPDMLARMGARVIQGKPGEDWVGVAGPSPLRPVLADLSDMPDAAMTLAAVACFAPGRSILRGLRTLRVKETDRVAALCREFAKLGVRVEHPVSGDADAITITPPPGGLPLGTDAPPVEFETYDDHRMAMSLAIVGLRRPNVRILNPACVGKTYPAFWTDLARIVECRPGRADKDRPHGGPL